MERNYVFGTGMKRPPTTIDAAGALKEMAQSDSWAVRAAVADAGCALDLLVTDSNRYVQRKAVMYLMSHGMTLLEWATRNPRLVHAPVATRGAHHGR